MRKFVLVLVVASAVSVFAAAFLYGAGHPGFGSSTTFGVVCGDIYPPNWPGEGWTRGSATVAPTLKDCAIHQTTSWLGYPRFAQTVESNLHIGESIVVVNNNSNSEVPLAVSKPYYDQHHRQQ